MISAEGNTVGPDFNLAVPTIEYGNPEICLYTLPNPEPGQLLNLTWYPELPEAPTIVLCDFEVKHADVVGFITREIRSRYPDAEIYFAVFGAMTKGRNLEVTSFDDLTGAGIMRAADFKAVFIAATMSPPGIEPPLELR